MKRIAFYVNAGKSGAVAVRDRLAAVAASCGLETAADAGAADCVVALGGDGTMLSAAHAFPGVPLLGLNLGSLGFLSGVEERDFDAAIRALATGAYALSQRTTIAVTVGGVTATALNDVVLSKGVSGHTARIALEADGRRVTCFTADGLVVATPTGSTAYSLSAGGPVLLPESGCLVVTPICPHALGSRPLVLPDTRALALRAASRDGALSVFADGRPIGALAEGGVLTVTKSAVRVPLVTLAGYDPYETLERKLGWNGSGRRTPPAAGVV